MRSLSESLNSFRSDRREPLPDALQCPKCKWVLTSHPDFEAWAKARGLTAFERSVCRCRCDAKAQQQAREAMFLLDAANLPRRYDDVGPRLFANLFVVEGLEEARKACWEFAHKQTAPILLLCGEKGCGKTHLLEATARQCLSRGESVRYENVVDLLDSIKATYSEFSQTTTDGLLDRYRRVSLLILDDLGAQRDSEWAEERLYALIDARYRDGRRLLVASKMPNGGLAASRIWSRLTDYATGVCHQVIITAGSYRQVQ